METLFPTLVISVHLPTGNSISKFRLTLRHCIDFRSPICDGK